MDMRGHLADADGVSLLAAAFAQVVVAADMDRGAAAQVGQGEVHLAIAAEGGAQQRE